MSATRRNREASVYQAFLRVGAVQCALVHRALAEGAGFEPAIRFPVYTLSRRAPSTTRPPLRRRPGGRMSSNLARACPRTGRRGAEYSEARSRGKRRAEGTCRNRDGLLKNGAFTGAGTRRYGAAEGRGWRRARDGPARAGARLSRAACRARSSRSWRHRPAGPSGAPDPGLSRRRRCCRWWCRPIPPACPWR